MVQFFLPAGVSGRSGLRRLWKAALHAVIVGQVPYLPEFVLV